MRFDFIEKPINLREIPKEFPVEMCLLENNESQINQICEFLQGEKDLLLVNGFKGSGKTQIINFTTTYNFNPAALQLRYTCLETTILDDMLLSFFDSFRNYTLSGQISQPKIKVENFTQKINSYFNTINRPILIILDSFDAIVKENKQDIINFIKHLINYPNIKVIIISKKLLADDFNDIEYEQVTTLALNEKLFEKYLRENGIKQIGVLSNELYKQTKGYYNYIQLSVNIMTLQQISLAKFLEMFSKSYVPFPEFILREAVALIDPVSAHLFRLLVIMRIPIHINLLNSLHLFDEMKVLFFIQNSILSVDGECLYLKDYIRDIIDNQIPDNVRIKLHSACIDLYNTQLPLKPLDRDLKLSRQTMRNEIEYHNMFLPKKPILPTQSTIQIPTDVSANAILEPETKSEQNNDIKIEETKEEKLEKISFIIEDEAVLDGIADTIKDFVITTVEDAKLEQESNSMTLIEILNSAKQAESQYNYKHAIMLYQSALTKTDDEEFYTFLPSIYVKLAKAYQNSSDLYEALEYYNQALDFYYNASNLEKVYEIKLEISNVYYAMYKHENAKFILSELEKVQNMPNELAIKINLACAKLIDNSDKEFNYYQKSIELIETGTDKSIVAELYYKYASACDERDDVRTAAEFYKKCIELDQNPNNNTYLSMSLANLAELYDSVGQTKFAIKYYNESIKVDTIIKNYNGLYNSAIHLSEIYSTTDTEKALEYMNKAYEYAKIINEPFYIVGATLELGDFYFVRKDYENAYKHFIKAYNLAKTSFTKDNINKIILRIEDLQNQLPEIVFNNLEEKYGK